MFEGLLFTPEHANEKWHFFVGGMVAAWAKNKIIRNAHAKSSK